MTEERTNEQILKDVLALVEDLTQDFDFDFGMKIGPGSRMVADLDFESTDVVELIGAVQEHFQNRSLPFRDLVLKNGTYTDFSIQDLADFLGQHLDKA